MRGEFWDTQPSYGGDRGQEATSTPPAASLWCPSDIISPLLPVCDAVIWDAVKAACEADIATARLILQAAGSFRVLASWLDGIIAFTILDYIGLTVLRNCNRALPF